MASIAKPVVNISGRTITSRPQIRFQLFVKMTQVCRAVHPDQRLLQQSNFQTRHDRSSSLNKALYTAAEHNKSEEKPRESGQERRETDYAASTLRTFSGSSFVSRFGRQRFRFKIINVDTACGLFRFARMRHLIRASFASALRASSSTSKRQISPSSCRCAGD